MGECSKYYVYKINKHGIVLKKNKCVEGWSVDFSKCWQFSKTGARGIVERLKSNCKNPNVMFGIVAVDEVKKMFDDYEKHLDYETYIAEEMNYRPREI